MAASAEKIATLAIWGPLERADLPGLFARTCSLLDDSSAELLRCEISDVAVDAVAVDALARLALAAGRRGCRVKVCGACAQLRALIELVGLTDVLAIE